MANWLPEVGVIYDGVDSDVLPVALARDGQIDARTGSSWRGDSAVVEEAIGQRLVHPAGAVTLECRSTLLRPASFWHLMYLLRSSFSERFNDPRDYMKVLLPLYRTAIFLRVAPLKSMSACTYSNSMPIIADSPLRPPYWPWPALDLRQRATDPDLSAFKKHGGKLLMYFGWADPQLNAKMGVKYYEQVVDKMGPSTDEFFRLFMVPGMFHCGGGVGTSQFDLTTPVLKWLEGGTAPVRIEASRVTAGKVVRTRPLCAYPQTARYKGTGSIDEAANFACVIE